MINVLAIAIGGALGSMSRYGMQKAFPAQFPVGTLLTNILGCFLIGYFWTVAIKGLSEPAHLFVLTGFCGGFTTFSAFSIEAVQMLIGGKWLSFSLYFIASTVGGLLATFIAYKIFSQ
jgi:CrcB protein